MICLIGEVGVWNVFSSLGITVIEAEREDEIISILDDIKEKDYRLVFLSEKLGYEIKSVLSEYLKIKGFNLVLIPSPLEYDIKETDSLSYKYLKTIVEKAMGVEIL